VASTKKNSLSQGRKSDFKKQRKARKREDFPAILGEIGRV
jgi:hypothetical protein